MIIVRYADDFIIGFQHESDARRFLDEMRERLGEVCAVAASREDPAHRVRTLCGGTPQAARARQAGDLQLPGLHLHLRQDPRGQIPDQTEDPADRMRAKLKMIKEEMWRRMHQPIPVQGKWLWHVVRGYFNYHAVPTNARALHAFRHHVTDLWRRTLRRRSQKDRTHVGTDDAAGGRLAPETDDPSSLAERSLCRHTPEVGAVCGKAARTDLCGGRSVNARPYRYQCDLLHLLTSAHGTPRQFAAVRRFGRDGGEADMPRASGAGRSDENDPKRTNLVPLLGRPQSTQSFTRAVMSGGNVRPSFASAEQRTLSVNCVAPAIGNSAGFRAVQNFVYVFGCSVVPFEMARPQRHEPARQHVFYVSVDSR